MRKTKHFSNLCTLFRYIYIRDFTDFFVKKFFGPTLKNHETCIMYIVALSFVTSQVMFKLEPRMFYKARTNSSHNGENTVDKHKGGIVDRRWVQFYFLLFFVFFAFHLIIQIVHDEFNWYKLLIMSIVHTNCSLWV